ncbi:DUF2589 domain-containing protein [Brachyspira pilosicoli]|uniref:DUF2589 domain-containing protein n=1 Tax=Brachyspira pilosicoli TaxID=52584 RepID=UPI00300577EB
MSDSKIDDSKIDDSKIDDSKIDDSKIDDSKIDDSKIANQFTGLPMSSLIAGPLQAVANAQLSLANTTKDFIETVDFDKVSTAEGKKEKSELKTVEVTHQKMDSVHDENSK